MGTNTAAALCIRGTGIERERLQSTLEREEALLVGQNAYVKLWEAPSVAVTWLCITPEDSGNALLSGAEASARALARELDAEVWSLWGFAGTVDFLSATAFAPGGVERWWASDRDGREKRVLRRVLTAIGRGAPRVCIGKYDFLKPEGKGWSPCGSFQLGPAGTARRAVVGSLSPIVDELTRKLGGAEVLRFKVGVAAGVATLRAWTRALCERALDARGQLHPIERSDLLRDAAARTVAWREDVAPVEVSVPLPSEGPSTADLADALHSAMHAVIGGKDTARSPDEVFSEALAELERCGPDEVLAMIVSGDGPEPMRWLGVGDDAPVVLLQEHAKRLVPRLLQFLEDSPSGAKGTPAVVEAVRTALVTSGHSPFAKDRVLIARLQALVEKTKSAKLVGPLLCLAPRFPSPVFEGDLLLNWQDYRRS
jgi:hypothetical protein